MNIRKNGKNPPLRRIAIRRKPGKVRHLGLLAANGRIIACELGRNGILAMKREGDGATPAGRWTIRQCRFRPDKRMRMPTRVTMSPLNPRDGWCDDPADGRYNRPVRLPFRSSHEKMFRDDRLYDLVLTTNHNEQPRIRNAGSAIFFHLSKPGRGPTEGCVAIDIREMRRLFPRLGPRTVLDVRI